MGVGVDLIMVNYRTAGDAAIFLRSLDRYPPAQPWRLTVANVAPLDDDRKVVSDWLTAHPHLDAREEQHADNCGYGIACNDAALTGSHDVVCFLNADVALTDGAVDQCADALRANPEWAVLGPRQRDHLGRITHGGIFGDPRRPRHRGWLEQDCGQYSDIRDDALTVSGSAYFVERSTWTALTECPVYKTEFPDATGAFLPLPLFYEETGCSYHSRQHGGRCVYFGAAVLEHRWHQSVKANGVHTGPIMERSLGAFRQFCAAHRIPCE